MKFDIQLVKKVRVIFPCNCPAFFKPIGHDISGRCDWLRFLWHWTTDFHWCLVSGMYWWTQVLSMMTNRHTKSVGSLLNRFKHCCECHLHICFWSVFRKCSTRLAQSFCISNSLFKMFCALSSTTSHTFTHLLSNTILCTFSVVSCMVAVFGWPSHGLSSGNMQPRLNSAVHFLTVQIEEADFL